MHWNKFPHWKCIGLKLLLFKIKGISQNWYKDVMHFVHLLCNYCDYKWSDMYSDYILNVNTFESQK